MYYVQNKFYSNSKKQTFNGTAYDSGFEAGYAKELELRLRAKDIKGYEAHKKIPLVVNGFLIANYYIDFVITHNDGELEYVECKGYPTEIWRLKWKLFEALYDGAKLTIIKQKDNFKLRKLKKLV